MNTCKENNLQKNLDEAIANAANACKVICTINTRFAQHGIPMLVIGENHSIMGEKGNRTLCIDRDDLPVAELKRGFPKLYSDVILLENTPSGV